jgi:UDP-N-acetylmuramoylalanine--D-glutamate ligase
MDKNKKFGVFGLGLSGLATMKFLAHQELDFIAFDDQENTILKIKNDCPKLVKNTKDLSSPLWKEIDYLVLSPGIALTYPKPHPVVKIAQIANAKIICDIELLYLNNPDAYFIGVTGTNGKSTTTALISHILKYNGLNASLGGNIGIPVLSLSSNSVENQIFVIEVSSFQLDLLDQTKFNIGVLLNITPDHLDRHGSMENYYQTKYKIFNHQSRSDKAIINAELDQATDKAISFSQAKGADVSVVDNVLYYRGKTYHIPYNNSLLGLHNQQNIAAAIACAIEVGLSPESIIAALSGFVGLKHRMQYLGEYNEVTFINDSKATNADSAAKALASFSNIIWIVGGVAKAGGIEDLKEYFPKIRRALLIGQSSDEFAKVCGKDLAWTKCNTMAKAFKLGVEIASPGDVILLSPACASYDQWKNFEQRGDAFIEMFQCLSRKH